MGRAYKRQSQCLLVALLCVFAGCDSYVSTAGHVLDESGNPIGGATVTLRPATESDGRPLHVSRTSPEGFFLVGEVYPPTTTRPEDKFLLRITKHGYKSYEEVIPSGIHADNNDAETRIVLKKAIPSATPGATATN